MSDRNSAASPPIAVILDSAHQQALLQIWLSPSFPVGGYAYSHALEKVVEAGWVRNRDDLQLWLRDLIQLGAIHNDLVLLACMWRAVMTSNATEIAEIAALASALHPSSERRLEASQQGQSFMDQIEHTWPYGAPSFCEVTRGLTPTLPVAVAYAAARHNVAISACLHAYAVATIGNLVSASIRLGVLGQSDGQRTLAATLDAALQACDAAARSTLDDLGAACWRSDIASLQHETQYTRLFRS